MEEVYVVGIGAHPWGKFPGKSFIDLGAEAVRNALKDAGVQWTDVPAAVSGIYVWGGTDALNAGSAIAGRLGETGIPILNVFNMCATATSAFRSAYHTVASGEQDMCLAIGVDVSPPGFFGFMGKPDPADTDYLRFRMVGVTNPAYWAMEARKRMEEHGTTERHFALAKVACSKHGSLNPDALYKRVYTEEEVLASPLVCDPLRLFEICATRDGAAAVLLCSAKKAKELAGKPVRVAGVGLGSSLYGDPTLRLGTLAAPAVGTAPLLSESWTSSQMAYKMAGIGPEDVDFVEVPDNSSWHYLQYLETLGLCEPGEADKLLENGETLVGGRLPVCPSGGASSYGEAISAQGLLQVCELVTQLRGDAGPRQVEGARVGLAQTYGQLGNSSTAILTR
ncbi:MAG TPA: lipid-transfer protein [Acidimicrobiales bacterium]|nr:lipid-transfer protein [Acidimicrobiales bacterium]